MNFNPARALRALYGMFLFVLVLAVYAYTVDPASDTKNLVIGVGTAVLGGCWLYLLQRGRMQFRMPSLFSSVLCAFLGLLLVGTLRSDYFLTSLREWLHLILLAILYLLASQLFRSPRQARRLLGMVCAAVFMAALYGIGQKLGFDPFPWQDRASDVYTNSPSTYGNPNFAAHALVLAMLMAGYFLITALLRPEGRKDAVLPGVALLVFFIHFVLTGQRGGVLALGGAALLVGLALWLGRRGKRPAMAAIGALGLMVLLGVGAMAMAMVISRGMSGLPLPLDPSILVRYQSYVSGVNMLLEHPLLGYGPGVYTIEYPRFWTPFEQQWFAQELAMNLRLHNDLLELSIEGGLLAGGLYLTLLVLGMGYGLAMGIGAADTERRALGLFFAAFFAAFFIDGLFGFNLRLPVTGTLFFVVLGLMEGLRERSPAQDAVESPKYLRITSRVALLALLLAGLVVEWRAFHAQRKQMIGVAALAQGETTIASTVLKEAADLAPWDANLPRRRALSYRAAGRPDVAERQLLNALELNPNFILARLDLANLKLAQAQELLRQPEQQAEGLQALAESRRHAEEILKLCPMFGHAQETVARCLYLRTALAPEAEAPALRDETMARLREAIENNPPNPDALYLIQARLLETQGDIGGAETALTRAAQTDVGGNELWTYFLEFAQKHQRYERARNTLQSQINRLKKREGDTSDGMATAQLWMGNLLIAGYNSPDGAEAAYVEAARLAPRRWDIWSNFARFAFANNRREALVQSVMDTTAALTAGGAQPLVQVSAVQAVKQHGLVAMEEASRALLEACQAHPAEDPKNRREMFGWAVRYLLEATPMDPKGGEGLCAAYLNLGMALNLVNAPLLAEDILMRAGQCLTPEMKPYAALHRADALLNLKRDQEALDLLHATLAESPQRYDVKWSYGRALAKLGHQAEAVATYRQLLESAELPNDMRRIVERELRTIEQ